MGDRDRVSELFLQLADRRPEERKEFLDRTCAGDPALRAQVESLLRHEDEAPAILKTGSPLAGAADALERIPAQIGPYRLLERLGEGGMGVVYSAEQQEPIRRQVAIKLVKRGLETKQVLQRFDAEYQVLALLDHPGIARVLDAGATAEGRPYFVMELVSGEPIHEFCASNHLDLKARLELFLQVCDAVHHAHQNAIIHRDIKPSNVLVTRLDGRAVPKIIDFGIAKALTPVVGGAAVTELGQAMGTLEYMSPEQASLAPEGIDIRTDVYSLGALLYELLCGAPPFDPEVLRGEEFDQARRRIASEEPLAPSGRAASVASAKELAGDLDSITMKALEKDRKRRYDSVLSLVADLRRYLRHEPVKARPWTTTYRFTKLVRKHRIPFAAAGALAFMLIAFSVTMVFQASRIARERDRAEEVATFLVQFYEAPLVVRGRHSITLGPLDVLQSSAARIDQNLVQRPLLAARLSHAMGKMFADIGELGDAEPLLSSAHGHFEMLGEEENALAASFDLAIVQDALGRPGAEEILLAALAGKRSLLGDEHPDTLWSMVEIGNHFKRAHASSTAVDLLEEAAAGLGRVLGPDHDKALVAGSVLAAIYLDQGRFDEAETVLSELIPRIDEGLAERANALFNLASVHAAKAEREPALASLHQAMESGFRIGIRSLRNWQPLLDDPEFIELAVQLEAQVNGTTAIEMELRHWARGDIDQAEAYIRTFLEVVPLSEGNVEWWRHKQVRALAALERFEEALPLLERNLEYLLRTYGPSHGGTNSRRHLLVQIQLGLGDVQGALVTLEEMRASYEHPQRLGPKEFYVQACHAALRGETEQALEHLYQSARRGLSRIDWLQDDIALVSVRTSPRFEEIIEEVRRRSWVP